MPLPIPVQLANLQKKGKPAAVKRPTLQALRDKTLQLQGSDRQAAIDGIRALLGDKELGKLAAQAGRARFPEVFKATPPPTDLAELSDIVINAAGVPENPGLFLERVAQVELANLSPTTTVNGHKIIDLLGSLEANYQSSDKISGVARDQRSIRHNHARFLVRLITLTARRPKTARLTANILGATPEAIRNSLVSGSYRESLAAPQARALRDFCVADITQLAPVDLVGLLFADYEKDARPTLAAQLGETFPEILLSIRDGKHLVDEGLTTTESRLFSELPSRIASLKAYDLQCILAVELHELSEIINPTPKAEVVAEEAAPPAPPAPETAPAPATSMAEQGAEAAASLDRQLAAPAQTTEAAAFAELEATRPMDPRLSVLVDPLRIRDTLEVALKEGIALIAEKASEIKAATTRVEQAEAALASAQQPIEALNARLADLAGQIEALTDQGAAAQTKAKGQIKGVCTKAIKAARSAYETTEKELEATLERELAEIEALYEIPCVEIEAGSATAIERDTAMTDARATYNREREAAQEVRTKAIAEAEQKRDRGIAEIDQGTGVSAEQQKQADLLARQESVATRVLEEKQIPFQAAELELEQARAQLRGATEDKEQAETTLARQVEDLNQARTTYEQTMRAQLEIFDAVLESAKS